jgi:[ribosomal protein S5]-alanine N-acetyltransferase
VLQPKFQPFPELKTARLLLRQLRPEDAAEIFFLRSDERVLRYLGKEPASSIKEAEDFIKIIDDNTSTNQGILWGIALLDNPDKLIGTICYWNLLMEHDRADIGFVLHPDHWRKGIMKEALFSVIDYGFGPLGLHSIEARLSAGNKSSAAVLESTGFVKEAYFKEDFFFKGQYSDTLVYSRLKK